MEDNINSEKKKMANLGCGVKVHPDWINIDFTSSSNNVISHDLIKGIPYKKCYFDVIYLSQVIEHFEKNQAEYFIKECYRTLKTNGIIRIVTPDLENIVDTYKDILLRIKESSISNIEDSNYNWILLELLDQSMRNNMGGEMLKFLKNPKLENEEFIINRVGHIPSKIRESLDKINPNKEHLKVKIINFIKLIISGFKKPKSILLNLILNSKEKEYLEIGKFRKSGEVHYWIYDHYSLKKLLENIGFRDVKIKSPFDSEIENWGCYQFDVKDNKPLDPTSLFVEAKK